MGTAIKHPVPDRVKPSFVNYDIRALWCSGLSVIKMKPYTNVELVQTYWIYLL